MIKKKNTTTGLNGFIGKNLREELKKDFEIFGIGRKKINQKNYFRINLNNKKQINKIFSNYKFDMVIHWHVVYKA